MDGENTKMSFINSSLMLVGVYTIIKEFQKEQQQVVEFQIKNILHGAQCPNKNQI